MDKTEIAKKLLHAVMIARGNLCYEDNPNMDMYWSNLREDPWFDEDSKAEFLAMADIVLKERQRCLDIVETNTDTKEAANEIKNGSSLVD